MARINSEKWVADFETTTLENDCRVWAWGVCKIGDISTFEYGSDIGGFLEWCKRANNPTVYFHNLRFDGEFIIDKLFREDFKHVESRKEYADKTFSTVISNMGVFYSIDIIFKKANKKVTRVTILDSLKLIKSSVDQIAKDFNIPFKKLTIDYEEIRPVGHILTAQEIEYLKHDCIIMALAMEQLFKYGANKLTIGSSALNDYKEIIGKKTFEYWFPKVEHDKDIRRAYRGGFTYCDPRFKNRIINRFNVFDVNSLYPSVMYYRDLPYGKEKFFNRQYEYDDEYPLYIQHLECQFELKEGHIPTIQLKHDGRFLSTKYLTSSKTIDKDGNEHDDLVNLYLTNIDLELFLKHYDVYNLEYLNGYKFKASNIMFRDYIDKWSANKIDAKKEGNGSLYTISKHFLNNLYGKFGTNPQVENNIPYFDVVDDRVKYKKSGKSERDAIYIPLAVFITSWARYTTITAAQENYDNFMYADTDSLHLQGREIPKNLDIDDTKLGAWAHEMQGWKAKYLGQKAYMEYGRTPNKHGVYKQVTVAGMPESCHEYVTLENFAIGMVYPNKKKSKRVRGGVIIYEDEHTMRPRPDTA